MLNEVDSQTKIVEKVKELTENHSVFTSKPLLEIPDLILNKRFFQSVT